MSPNFKPRAIALAGLAALVSTVAAAPQPPLSYIVQLADPPAAAYRGNIRGLAATQVAEGARLRAADAPVRAYVQHLETRRNALLAALGGVQPLHTYDYIFNGFSARLTAAQVQRLHGLPGVLRITLDARHLVATNRTPVFLGLDGPDGVWTERGHGSRLRGEDLVIGVIDSGVQPEDASFSDRQDAKGNPTNGPGTVVYGPTPAGWAGGCVAGPGFDPAKHCNHKLIGAKAFDAGFRAASLPPSWFEFAGSPRDSLGHGSHTASTAGGNQGVNARENNGPVGKISGMAPRARLASYKVCWTWHHDEYELDFNECWNSDAVAAIDAAVADGVDIINFSIGGSSSTINDPVELAFLNAAAAGVFVAAAAGNGGPANTLGHASPWLTTVAASTHDRVLQADATLGNGVVHNGLSMSGGLPQTPLILASDARTATASIQDAQWCLADTLDPAKAAGKVVACDRRGSLRVDKSLAVRKAGGVGMLLLNVPSSEPDANTLYDDPHWVPTVHLLAAEREAVQAYAALPGATTALGVAALKPGVVAPVMAAFSSRGPNLAVSDVLKPDITAPGVNVVAAFATAQADPAMHDAIVAGTLVPKPAVAYLNGTSMSTPHIAGLAALLKQRWPAMSPARIKSALMTTATAVRLADGSPDPDLNGYGAGHVDPAGALDPGLVYPIKPDEYYAYLCGKALLPAADPLCLGVRGLPGTELNLPSFSADVAGVVSFQRQVNNLGPAGSYTASVSLPGFDATVSPATLNLAANGSAKYTLTLKANGSVPLDSNSVGSLDWRDVSHVVHSPISARSRLFSGPSVLDSELARGGLVAPFQFGFAGPLSHSVGGLVEATRRPGTVKTARDPGPVACLSNGPGVAKFPVVVPAGALVTRFALYDADTGSGGGDKLDLYIYDGSGALVAIGTEDSSNETITMISPAAGTYTACVHGYEPADGVSASFTFSSWVVNPGEGAMLANHVPGSVALGDIAKVRLSWKNATRGKRYLGALALVQGADAAAGTPMTTLLLNVEPGVVASSRGSNGAHATALPTGR